MLRAHLKSAFLTTALLALCASVEAKDQEPLPYDVGVAIRYGNVGGPERYRQELEHRLIHGLGQKSCFRKVERFDPQHPGLSSLELLILIDEFEETMQYDVSMATLNDPRSSEEVQRQVTAQAEARIRLELRTLPEFAVVRSRDLTLHESYRPVFREDPRYEVRRLMVDELIKLARGFACKGSSKKLTRQIEAARAEAPASASPAR
jgi:hypothetical protein